jgi:hypothetical protein
VTDFFGKAVICGAVSAVLATVIPSSALADYPVFAGQPVFLDAYNASLAAAVPSSAEPMAAHMAVALNVGFSGGAVDLDAYNATLAELPSVATMEQPYSSYALVPDYPRLWEGPLSFEK